jgi:hypothetical protein
MDRSELEKILQERNVPNMSYSLNGLKGGECLCIVEENDVWKVIYNSRGRIGYLAICADEENACEVFFGIMKKSY